MIKPRVSKKQTQNFFQVLQNYSNPLESEGTTTPPLKNDFDETKETENLDKNKQDDIIGWTTQKNNKKNKENELIVKSISSKDEIITIILNNPLIKKYPKLLVKFKYKYADLKVEIINGQFKLFITGTKELVYLCRDAIDQEILKQHEKDVSSESTGHAIKIDICLSEKNVSKENMIQIIPSNLPRTNKTHYYTLKILTEKVPKNYHVIKIPKHLTTQFTESNISIEPIDLSNLLEAYKNGYKQDGIHSMILDLGKLCFYNYYEDLVHLLFKDNNKQKISVENLQNIGISKDGIKTEFYRRFSTKLIEKFLKFLEEFSDSKQQKSYKIISVQNDVESFCYNVSKELITHYLSNQYQILSIGNSIFDYRINYQIRKIFNETDLKKNTTLSGKPLLNVLKEIMNSLDDINDPLVLGKDFKFQDSSNIDNHQKHVIKDIVFKTKDSYLFQGKFKIEIHKKQERKRYIIEGNDDPVSIIIKNKNLSKLIKEKSNNFKEIHQEIYELNEFTKAIIYIVENY